MSQFQFQSDRISNAEDLSCIICGNLMMDACHGVCGCRYCYGCISKYLGEGNKHCPGNNVACKRDNLVMERDVTRTVRMNSAISQLKVQCPNDSCRNKVELLRMSEHIQTCCKEVMQCPYWTLGCDNGQNAKDVILEHLKKDSLTHIQLLIEFIHNLKNEVDGLKNDVEKNKQEIASLKEESKMKDIQIDKITEQMASQKDDIMDQISKQSNVVVGEDNKVFVEHLTEIKREIENMRLRFLSQETRILSIQKRLHEERSELNMILTADIDTRRSDIDNMRKDGRMERENVAMMLNSMNRNVNVVKEEVEKQYTSRDRAMLRWNKLCANIEGDFVWRINDCGLKKGTYFHSEPFYSNNYKFCLRLYVYYEDIGLYWYIMKGDKDDHALWPMKRLVTLSIVDQSSMKTHKSYTYKYDSYKGDKRLFDRPMNDMNGGIGECSFMKYLSKNHLSVIVNDSIVVSCVISDP